MTRKKLLLLSISFSIISCVIVIFELAGYSYHYPLKFGKKFLFCTNVSSSLLSSNEEMIKSPQLSTTIITELEEESIYNTSTLGAWLRAPEGTPPPLPNNAFNHIRPLILVWRHGPFLERRHARRSSTNNSDSSSAWQECSVKNCLLSYRDDDLSKADAVIFHLHLTKGIEEIPPAKGKSGQIWIFMTDESPIHTFLHTNHNRNISIYDDTFDWSMTYRGDSDVPVAYGRTIPRRNVLINAKQRQKRKGRNIKLVAIMGSNCSSSKNQRWKYVKELKALLDKRLDIYGRCLGGNTIACPGHFHQDCSILANYKFYLAFENSNCREYITEKVYWNAYEKGSVPIIMGAPRIDCERLLPPRSFIHVDDFISSRDLADYLLHLDENDEAYENYHQWRSTHIVINEHGYFGSTSKHYCRVCEALHYNTQPPTIPKYHRIGDYWNSNRDCFPYAGMSNSTTVSVS